MATNAAGMRSSAKKNAIDWVKYPTAPSRNRVSSVGRSGQASPARRSIRMPVSTEAPMTNRTASSATGSVPER